MADNRVDPSGNTEAFRAFSENAPQDRATGSQKRLVIGLIVAVVLLVGLFVWLATQ